VLSRPAVNATGFQQARQILTNDRIVVVFDDDWFSLLIFEPACEIGHDGGVYIAWRGMLAGRHSFDHAFRGDKLAPSEFGEVVDARPLHSNALY
jgi:hypothetical protein